MLSRCRGEAVRAVGARGYHALKRRPKTDPQGNKRIMPLVSLCHSGNYVDSL